MVINAGRKTRNSGENCGLKFSKKLIQTTCCQGGKGKTAKEGTREIGVLKHAGDETRMTWIDRALHIEHTKDVPAQ